MVRPLLFGSAILALGVAASFAGCGGALAPLAAGDGGRDAFPAGGSSGNGSSGGFSSSSSSGVASSSSGSTGVGSSGSGSSSGGTSSGGTTTGGDDGGTCPSGGSIPYPVYATPPKGAGECTSADVQGFISACVTSQATCETWFETNVGAADGGGGTTCGDCLFNQANPNLGAVWYGSTAGGDVDFAPNYGACIAMLDTNGGAACATAYDDANACEVYACGDCATEATYENCATSVSASGGTCASDATSESQACATEFADGGVGTTTCSPTTVYDPGDSTTTYDFEFIANLICGSGATTFQPDGG